MKKSLKLLLLLCLLLPATVNAEEYRASVWLRVAKTRPKIMFDIDGGDHYLSDPKAQTTLIRSPLVLDLALQEPGIAELDCLKDVEDKAGWLSKKLDVDYLGSSEILQIAISGSDADELEKILAAVRVAYMDRVVVVGRELDMRQKMMLEQVYENVGKNIQKKTTQYRNMLQQAGLTEFDVAVRDTARVAETVNALQLQKAQLTARMIGLDRRIKVLGERREGMEEQRQAALRTLAVKALSEDPSIARLRENLVDIDEQLQTLLEEVENPEENEEVAALRTQFDRANRKLQKRAQEMVPRIEENVKAQMSAGTYLPEFRAVNEEYDRATLDFETCLAEREQLEKSLQQLLTSAVETSAAFEKIAPLRDEVERLKQIHAQLGQKLNEWNIESQAPQRVQTINEPTVVKIR